VRRILVLGAAVVALVMASVAVADVGLILRRAAVSAGERMTVWGSCFRMPVYLVGAEYAKQARIYENNPVVARPPRGREFRLLGRMVCTNQMHYIGDYPNGDWSSWNGYLTFRVPQVPAGRYQLVVYCEPCHRGPGGTLIVNNWLWRGPKRVGETGLTVRG
jgi:hypothetical protein